MILEEIRVQSFGILRQPLALDNLSPQVNVVCGPNESGKSTLMQALTLGVFDRYNVTGQGIKGFLPWGAEVGPQIEMVFVTSGERFRLEKRFYLNPHAKLFQNLSGHWELVAEGEKVEEKMRAFWHSEAPSKGLTSRDKQGLAQVLWLPQGNVLFEAELNDGVMSRLEAVLGTTVTTPLDRKVIDLVQREYEKIFTFKTGKLRAGTLLEQLQRERQEVEQRLRQVQEKSEQLEQVEQQLDAVQELLSRLAGGQSTAGREKEETEALYLELKRKKDKAEAARLLWQQEDRSWRQAEGHWSQIVQKRQEILQAQARFDAVGDGLRAAQRQVEAVRGEGELARAAMERGVQGLKRERAQLEVENHRLRLAETRLRMSEHSQKMEAWEGEENRRTQALQRMRQLQVPERKELQLIRDLQRQVEVARAGFEAAALSFQLQVDPERAKPLSIRQLSESGEEQVHVSPGEVQLWKAAEQLVLQIEGVGEIRVHAGQAAGASRSLEERLGQAQKALQEKMLPFAHQTLEQLEAGLQERERLQGEVRAAESAQRALAPEGKEALWEEQQRLERLAESLREQLPETAGEGMPEEVEAARTRCEAQAANIKAVEREVERLRADCEAKQQALQQAMDELAGLQAQQAGLEAALKGLRNELADLTRDGLADELRMRQLAQKKETAEQAKAAFEALAVSAEEEEEVRKLRDLAHSRWQNLSTRLEEEKSKQDRLAGHLESAQREGLYAQQVKWEEALEVLMQREAAERQRAQAVKLLFDSLERNQQTAVARVLEPVEQRVARGLERLIGGRYNAVHFTNTFKPDSLDVKAYGVAARVQDLSMGTQEQLNLLVRLTLGEILAEEERQLVVLDDPLVNTDPLRRKRLLQMIGEAAERLQVLIFTCHPDHYAALDGRFYDMDQLKSGFSETAAASQQ